MDYVHVQLSRRRQKTTYMLPLKKGKYYDMF